MPNPLHAPSRIPVFGSIEEEAEFWDTHDSTDFEDEWEPVDVEVSPTLHSRFFLRAEVDRATLRRVRESARDRGLTSDELVGRWVVDGLAREDSGEADAQDRRPQTG